VHILMGSAGHEIPACHEEGLVIEKYGKEHSEGERRNRAL
jgi:hypothetical protein